MRSHTKKPATRVSAGDGLLLVVGDEGFETPDFHRVRVNVFRSSHSALGL